MRFTVERDQIDLKIVQLFVAGWTGRDRRAVAHHIRELGAIGVAPPSATPLFYRASAQLATQASTVEVVGESTSGEAEPLLVATRGGRFLGLGSDHTDRDLEARSVALSKQVCPKPIARELWPFEAVAAVADDIRVESWIYENGRWAPYQAGTLADILPLAELYDRAPLDATGLAAGEAIAMLCGTFPVLGDGIRPATRFRMVMTHPHGGAAIEHEYRLDVLPAVA